MHPIISRLLRKRGINDVNELDSDEKKTFEAWQEVLQKEELSVEDIKNFCRMQVEIIETKWSDYNSSNKSEMIPYHTIWTMLLKAIEGPKQAKVALEKNLEQLLK